MENYFDKNFPDDNEVTRKVRIGLEAFNRIQEDAPTLGFPIALDMAMKIADIEPLTIEYDNLVNKIFHGLKA